MTITVVVTTYGRRAYLEGCLGSLVTQSRPPDEIVVVTRAGDDETNDWLRGFLAGRRAVPHFRRAEVDRPGVLAANRAGLALVTGEILCFLDDDAAARPDWIERIERHFEADPGLGALGGRDVNQTRSGILDDEPAATVGRILWYGRIIGNHHRRVAGVHEVQTLKGVNMAYRRSLVSGFDEGIVGNAHYYETDLVFAVRRAGYRALWDGALLVDHFVDAPRHLPGSVHADDPQRHFYMHHNRVYVMMKNLPPVRRGIFLVYTFASDALSGILRRARGAPEGRPEILRAIFQGKLAGWRSWRERRTSGALRPGRAAA